MAKHQPLTERDVDILVNNLRGYDYRIAEALANNEKATARWLTMCQRNLAVKTAASDIGWQPQ